MKILLTGSSGFLGTALTQRLEGPYNLHHLTNDLKDHKKVEQEVLAVNPDLIIHLAARTEVQESFVEQVEFSQINYVGTVNLIESAMKLPHLKNFLFSSTMETYGWQPISDEVRDNSVPETFIFYILYYSLLFVNALARLGNSSLHVFATFLN